MFPLILFLDIDECVTKIDNCDTNAACRNNDGSYFCSCNVGYSGNGKTCQGMLTIRDLPNMATNRIFETFLSKPSFSDIN